MFQLKKTKQTNAPVGTIFVDSILLQLKMFNIAIENFRVEQKTDYEKLVFNIKLMVHSS